MIVVQSVWKSKIPDSGIHFVIWYSFSKAMILGWWTFCFALKLMLRMFIYIPLILINVLVLFSFLVFCDFRRSTSCPTKCYWIYFRMCRIVKYAEWLEYAVDGVKWPTIHDCGGMCRCDLRCPVCMLDHWICYCNWYPFDLVHRCDISSYQSNLSLIRFSMNWPPNAQI